MNMRLRLVLLYGLCVVSLVLPHHTIAEVAQPKKVGDAVSKNNQLDLTDTQDTTATVDPNAGPYVKISSVLFEPPSGWAFKEFKGDAGSYVDIIPGSIDGYTANADPDSSSQIRVHWLTNSEPTSVDEFGLRAEGNMSPPTGFGGSGGEASLFAWAAFAATPVTVAILRDEDGGSESYKPLDEPQSVQGKTLRDALPGQKINLKCIYTPPEGKTITGYTWEIGGVIFKEWEANNTFGIRTAMAVADLDEQKVHFYWTNSGSHDVKVIVTLNDNSTESVTEALNIAAPIVTFGADIGVTATGQSNVNDPGFDPAIGLFSTGGTRVGFPNPGGTPSKDGVGAGIVFTGKVQMPAGWPETAGKWNWVQLVTPDRTFIDGGVAKKVIGNGLEYLDATYPYQPASGFYTTGTGGGAEHKDSDSPHTIDSGSFTEMRIGSERFRTWLMFRPPGDQSRYVPTKRILWQWGGKTVKAGGVWGAATDAHQNRSSAEDTTEHPEWLGNAPLNLIPTTDPPITITFAVANVTEGDGVINGQATASVPANVVTNLQIDLFSSNTAKITVPSTITIPNGSNSIGFSFTVVDNAVQDGDATVLVFGQALNYISGSDSIVVKDND